MPSAIALLDQLAGADGRPGSSGCAPAAPRSRRGRDSGRARGVAAGQPDVPDLAVVAELHQRVDGVPHASRSRGTRDRADRPAAGGRARAAPCSRQHSRGPGHRSSPCRVHRPSSRPGSRPGRPPYSAMAWPIRSSLSPSPYPLEVSIQVQWAVEHAQDDGRPPRPRLTSYPKTSGMPASSAPPAQTADTVRPVDPRGRSQSSARCDPRATPSRRTRTTVRVDVDGGAIRELWARSGPAAGHRRVRRTRSRRRRAAARGTSSPPRR